MQTHEKYKNLELLGTATFCLVMKDETVMHLNKFYICI